MIFLLCCGGDDDNGTPGEQDCRDLVDNDGDGDIDCLDSDCADDPFCLFCGNGVLEAAEECDGTALGDFTSCAEIPGEGYTDGTLRCSPNCRYDTSSCFREDQCTDVSLAVIEGPYAYWEHVEGENDNWFSLTRVILGDEYTYELYIETWGHTATEGIQLGTHVLGQGREGNYGTCAYCVLLSRCLDVACEEFVDFLAVAGTLVLTSLDASEGGKYAGSLEDVTFAEVEIAWNTDWTSTPVEDGECYDLTEPYVFDATLISYPP